MFVSRLTGRILFKLRHFLRLLPGGTRVERSLGPDMQPTDSVENHPWLTVALMP